MLCLLISHLFPLFWGGKRRQKLSNTQEVYQIKMLAPIILNKWYLMNWIHGQHYILCIFVGLIIACSCVSVCLALCFRGIKINKYDWSRIFCSIKSCPLQKKKNRFIFFNIVIAHFRLAQQCVWRNWDRAGGILCRCKTTEINLRHKISRIDITCDNKIRYKRQNSTLVLCLWEWKEADLDSWRFYIYTVMWPWDFEAFWSGSITYLNKIILSHQ